jgi:hypothetical protein
LPVLRGMIDATNLIKSANSTLFLILDGLYSNTKYSLVIHLKTIDKSLSYFQIISNKTIETSVKNKSKMTSAFQLLKLKNNNYDDLNNSEYDVEEEEEEDEEEEDYVNDEYLDEFNNNNQNIKERIIGCDLDVADSNKIFTIDYHSSRMIKQITYLFKNKTDFIDYYYYNNKSNLNDLATSLSNFKDFFSLYNFNKDSLHFSVYDECIKQFETNKKANYILLKPLCIFNLESIWESLIKDSKLKNEYFSIQTSLFTKQNSLVHIATACHLKPTTNNLLINEITTTTLKSPTSTTTVVLNHNKLINSDTFDLNDCRIINGNQINFTIKYKNTRSVYKFEIIETNSREHILSNNIKIATNNNSNYQVSSNNN